MAEKPFSPLTEAQIAKIKRRDDELYERFAKHLEKEKKGEFVAISLDGQVIVNPNHLELLRMAIEKFGPGNFTIRKIGYPYTLKWR